MMTLLVLVSATWVGLYLAKRITRPVQLLAAGAREIAAGHLDHRIEPETRDEFGGLIEAFNSMAGDLAASQRRLERSRMDLELKNVESEQRRRYIETILERIATGVISLDADGRVSTVNGAAMRLLKVDPTVAGQPLATMLARPDLAPLAAALDRVSRSRTTEHTGQEVALVVDGREVHLAVASTRLVGDGEPEGTVVVFDDVTPLIRAQKVAAWRDVARRLAHEVKNPLTPIQLSAERLRRHFSAAPEPQRTLVEECGTSPPRPNRSARWWRSAPRRSCRRSSPQAVGGRVLAVRAHAGAADRHDGPQRPHARRAGALPRSLHVDHARTAPRRGPARRARRSRAVPPRDHQPGRQRGRGHHEFAAGGRPGRSWSRRQHDPANGVVRVIVADNGPGVPDAERGRLFLPYYSTKQRGSGLGLAIVRRIIVEHGGSIEATDNPPRGTRMTIEVPA